MGDKNASRRRRTLSGCTTNSVDSSYYEDTEQQQLINHTTKIISCPDSVFNVVRKFDERKKDLVRSIGFSGLLHLSRFSELDVDFTLWLNRKVRLNTSSLHPCGKIKLVLKPEHIGKIIGIPYSGIEVKDKAFESEDQKIAFMKLSLSFLGNESEILEAAQHYLQQDLPYPLSKEEANKFKVAFVIYVMGRLLAPSLDTSVARCDFWGALKNPDAIHSFNWSAFVLSDIMEAARHVVWDTLRNINIKAILGCPLILQIFYLDIMELGPLKLPHDVLPRVKHFNRALLSRMIEADIEEEESTTGQISYGRAKAMRSDNTCYNFGDTVSSMSADHSPIDSNQIRCAQVIQNTSVQEASNFQARGKDSIIQNNSPNFRAHPPLNRTSDSDVPDFPATMRDYFQGQVDPSLLECFRFHQAMCLQHLVKFTNGLKAAITKENITLVSKVVNHQRRCSGLTPINLELKRPSVTRRNYDAMLSGAESGDDNTPSHPRKKQPRVWLVLKHHLPRNTRRYGVGLSTSSSNEHGSSSSPFSPNPIASLISPNKSEQNTDNVNFTTPLNFNRKPTISLGMPFVSGGNLSIRTSSAVNLDDLNQRRLDAEYSESPIAKKHVQAGRFAATHWSRSIDHPARDFSLTRSFFDWLSSTTSVVLKKDWIIHVIPRFIKLTGKQLKDNFTDIQPMSFDSFDLCVRRIRQLDKAICPKDVQLRWRHLLESDFSMHVLGGENPVTNVSIRNQFVSTLLDYHLERCRMFFVPVFVDGLWLCYAWDLKSLTLIICDPSVGQENDSLVIQKHAGTIDLLNKFLSETIYQFYTGWDPKFHGCNVVVFRDTEMPIERCKSAFFTLFFIKYYNGTNLVTATSPSALQIFKEYMLYEILELKENSGSPPSSFIHSIDD